MSIPNVKLAYIDFKYNCNNLKIDTISKLDENFYSILSESIKNKKAPGCEVLFKFSKIRLRKKRFKKKFMKNYTKYVSDRVRSKYWSVIMSNTFAGIISKVNSLDITPIDERRITWEERIKKIERVKNI